MAPREHTLLNLAYKLAAVQVTDFHGNAGTPPTLYGAGYGVAAPDRAGSTAGDRGQSRTDRGEPSRRITGRSTQSCLAEDRQSGPIQVDGIRPEQWANLDRVALLTWEGPAFFRRLAELHRARLLTIEAEDFYRELDEHG
jgi:hypothetical protein